MFFNLGFRTESKAAPRPIRWWLCLVERIELARWWRDWWSQVKDPDPFLVCTLTEPGRKLQSFTHRGMFTSLSQAVLIILCVNKTLLCFLYVNKTVPTALLTKCIYQVRSRMRCSPRSLPDLTWEFDKQKKSNCIFNN